MKTIVKKIAIFSVAGVMQLGLLGAVTEASPHHDDRVEIIQVDDHFHSDHNNWHERERDERWREHRERDREHWERDQERREQERQEQENDNNTAHEIAAGVIGFILGAATH